LIVQSVSFATMIDRESVYRYDWKNITYLKTMFEKRQTISEGELVKINTYLCRECGRLYLSPYVASKIGLNSGWYSKEALTSVLKNYSLFDSVVRTRLDRKNLKTCPDCRR
jgi:hypothetical protein